jgi:hypothetical protein
MVVARTQQTRPGLAGVPHGATCLRVGGQEDSSLTRSNQYLLELFERAGLVVKYNILQRSFPKELFKARPCAPCWRARPACACRAGSLALPPRMLADACGAQQVRMYALRARTVPKRS